MWNSRKCMPRVELISFVVVMLVTKKMTTQQTPLVAVST